MFCATAEGYWSITRLPIPNGDYPVINNSGEIVWASPYGGIYSSTRGRLSRTGTSPRLLNTGEVVYQDFYNAANGSYDLVSTTRGRLTTGGFELTGYDINSSGEVVYTRNDQQGNSQVFSTVRGQITFDAVYHYSPCINDLGETIWGQYIPTLEACRTVSNTRGILPLNYGSNPQDLNNLGDVCFDGALGGNGPHIFSSAHGVLINDPAQNQWFGGINDLGAIVWEAPASPGSGAWYVYKGVWIVPEPSALALLLLGGLFLLGRFQAGRR